MIAEKTANVHNYTLPDSYLVLYDSTSSDLSYC